MQSIWCQSYTPRTHCYKKWQFICNTSKWQKKIGLYIKCCEITFIFAILWKKRLESLISHEHSLVKAFWCSHCCCFLKFSVNFKQLAGHQQIHKIITWLCDWTLSCKKWAWVIALMTSILLSSSLLLNQCTDKYPVYPHLKIEIIKTTGTPDYFGDTVLTMNITNSNQGRQNETKKKKYKCSRWTYFKWVSRGQNWSNYPGINDLTAAVGNARLCVGCGKVIGKKTYLFLIVELCGGLTSCQRHLTLLSFLILMKYCIH